MATVVGTYYNPYVIAAYDVCLPEVSPSVCVLRGTQNLTVVSTRFPDKYLMVKTVFTKLQLVKSEIKFVA
jgi:hypothetical protein